MTEAEIEAAEVPVVPRPVLLRQCTILLGGETDPPEILADPEYPVGAFEVLDEELGVSSSIAVIAIGEIDKRVLVAFPQEAWHRTLAKRRLPHGSFLKAVPASVGFCDRRSNLAEEVDNKKIWIGFLSPAAEDRVVFPEGEEYPEPDIAFDPSSPEILPIAKDLREVVERLFQFTSATSGGEWHAPQSASTFDQRMVALETTVSEIAESLKNLTTDQGANHRKPALRKPEVTFAPTSKAPSMAAAASSMAPPPGLQAPIVAGLDLEVVQSARQAGIPEQQIVEMAKLASRGKPRMQDLPEKRGRPKVSNPLSESEDEETEAAEDENQGGGDAGKLVTAVSQLTKIASHLTKQKNRNKDLDSLLDGAGSAHSTDSSSIPSSRRYAAALRALRKMLRDRPKDIYEAVEANMEADFQVRTQMPGSEAVAVSARAWLELRSNPKLWHSCEACMGGCRGDGLLEAGIGSGGKSEVRSPPRSWRSTVGGPRQLDSGSGNPPGGVSSIRCLQPSPVAHGDGAPSHPSYRRQMDRPLCAEDQRLRFLSREEEEAGPRTWSSFARPSSSRSQRSSQRSWQRERRRWICTGSLRPGGLDVLQAAATPRSQVVGHPVASTDEDEVCEFQCFATELLPPTTMGGSADFKMHEEKNYGSGGKCDVSGNTSRQAPGARADTVHVDHLWNSQLRWLLKSQCGRLRTFIFSSFQSRSRKVKVPCTSRPVWPLPLLALKQSSSDFPLHEQRCLQNMILVMNWLALGQPGQVPPDYCGSAPMSGEQRGIVARFRSLTKEWVRQPPVTSEDMGRTAGKIESLQDSVKLLTVQAAKLLPKSGSGTGQFPTTFGADGQASSLLREVQAAKEIEADRLQFSGKPVFNPAPFLTEASRQLYERPLDHSIPEAECLQIPPRVKVRGKRSEVMKLLRALDSTDRLAVFPEAEVRSRQFHAGLFCLMKNSSSDRLILDARPSNLLEEGQVQWAQTMGSVTGLLDWRLDEGFNIISAGEDLKDYYYFYAVTRQRSARDALAFVLQESEAKELKAYKQTVKGAGRYVASLATMATGDLNSVEFGQQAHVRLALSGGLKLTDLLTLRSLPPRLGRISGWLASSLTTSSASNKYPEQ